MVHHPLGLQEASLLKFDRVPPLLYKLGYCALEFCKENHFNWKLLTISFLGFVAMVPMNHVLGNLDRLSWLNSQRWIWTSPGWNKSP